VRIAVTGKGGSGKTTVSSLLIRWLVSRGRRVLAIDGDINQHLGQALGFDEAQVSALPKLGNEGQKLRQFVKGSNPHLKSLDHIVETTPPGRGSGFIRFGNRENPILKHFSLIQDNLQFVAIGGHSQEEVATTCYHKFTAAEGIFLNHLLDRDDEIVIGDMVAGADPFASSGIASRYDIIVVVVEPTIKSLEVFRQACGYLAPFGLAPIVVGNKVNDIDDLRFLEENVGDALIGCLGASKFIRALDRGDFLDISHLEEKNREILATIEEKIDITRRDWKHLYDVGLKYHKIVADSWGERWLGVDPLTQIDPAFSYDWAWKSVDQNGNGVAREYSSTHSHQVEEDTFA
jgi:CO dehydrogenase maturation factor